MTVSQGAIIDESLGADGFDSTEEDSGFSQRTSGRLEQAFRMERLAGLKLATVASLAALAAIAALLVLLTPVPWLFGYEAGLATLAIVMIAHYRVQRAAPDRVWISYVFVALIMLVMALTMILPDMLIPTPFPPQMFLRNGTGVYYFVIIALISLNYAPGLTLWAGIAGVVSWGAVTGFYNALPGTVSSTELDFSMSPDETLRIMLDPRYVGLDVRLQDLAVMLVVTAILATAVARSRRLVLRQALVERERGNLARYFPPQIVDRLSHSDEPLASVRAQRAAVLFADIVGFTHMAEQEEPERVIALLRSFHRRLEQAVFANEGTLDKFLGDGVMATFGTPQNGPRDALNALSAARDMLNTIDAWNRKRDAAGKPPIRLSIGLHYGPVVMGDIGSERRMEFAVLGDTVNVANRLEGQSRVMACQVIASEALVERARQESPAEAATLLAEFRPGEPQQLRGRVAQVPVWIAGTLEPADPGAGSGP